MIAERLHYEAAEVVGSEPINHPELHRALCGRVADALDVAEKRGAERYAQRMRELHLPRTTGALAWYCVACGYASPCPTERALAEVAPPTAGQEGQP